MPVIAPLLLDVVACLGKACVAGTVRTAEESAAALDAVTDHLASAVLAHGRQLMNRAFKAVEDVPVTSRDHLKAEMVIVAADFTFRHGSKTSRGSIPVE